MLLESWLVDRAGSAQNECNDACCACIFPQVGVMGVFECTGTGCGCLCASKSILSVFSVIQVSRRERRRLGTRGLVQGSPYYESCLPKVGCRVPSSEFCWTDAEE